MAELKGGRAAARARITRKWTNGAAIRNAMCVHWMGRTRSPSDFLATSAFNNAPPAINNDSPPPITTPNQRATTPGGAQRFGTRAIQKTNKANKSKARCAVSVEWWLGQRSVGWADGGWGWGLSFADGGSLSHSALLLRQELPPPPSSASVGRPNVKQRVLSDFQLGPSFAFTRK